MKRVGFRSGIGSGHGIPAAAPNLRWRGPYARRIRKSRGAVALRYSIRVRGFALATTLALALAQASAARAQRPEQSARQEFLKNLVAAAEERTHHTVRYDPAYVRIPYPGGDVPADTGVCTDEVIRSYRALGVDLQKEVHEDMERNFSAYPRKWRWLTSHTDTNIDHRRVPNLMVFFSRKGETLPITPRAEDYSPGDLVTWDLGGGVPHIGIVVNEKSAEGRHLIVHNIGQGPKREDVLFRWKITGHYRYLGPPAVAASSTIGVPTYFADATMAAAAVGSSASGGVPLTGLGGRLILRVPRPPFSSSVLVSQGASYDQSFVLQRSRSWLQI